MYAANLKHVSVDLFHVSRSCGAENDHIQLTQRTRYIKAIVFVLYMGRAASDGDEAIQLLYGWLKHGGDSRTLNIVCVNWSGTDGRRYLGRQSSWFTRFHFVILLL